jgi:hypothetical protein
VLAGTTCSTTVEAKEHCDGHAAGPPETTIRKLSASRSNRGVNEDFQKK